MKNSGPCIPALLLLLMLSVQNAGAQQEDEDAGALLQLYIETGSYEYLEKISEAYPDTPYALFCEAYEYIGTDNKTAREATEALVRDHPSFAPGYFVLGTVLTDGYKEFDEAVSYFDRALELDRDFSPVYQYRGIAYLGMGDYEDAWQDFNRMIENKRGYAEGYILRGIASRGMGEKEAFLADFEIGLQIDYKALAPLISSLAGQAIDEAIEFAPENIIYLYARGYACFSNGNYRLAAADFKRAIELVPGSPDFYKYSGACKLYLDDGEGALRDLNIAQGSNPDDPEIYYYLGVLMNNVRKQYSLAYEYLSRSLELDNRNADCYYQRAESSYEMLNYRAAMDDINMAILHNHREGDFYALRGFIGTELGSPADDACRDFREALEWGTGYNLKKAIRKTCD